MGDKTLGELVANITRFKAQLVPLVALLVIAFFLEGTHERTPSAEPQSGRTAAAVGDGQQIGSASVPPALAGPSLAFGSTTDTDATVASDLTAAGPDAAAEDTPAGGADSTPAPSAPAAITCENDAGLPQPVFGPAMEQLRGLQQQLEAAIGPLPDNVAGYVSGAAGCSPGLDPLSLVVNQLGPVLGAAGPVLDVMKTVNSALPPIPVPPPLALPGLPAELNPVLTGALPVTSAVCGELGIAFVAIVLLGSFPLPLTGQHFAAGLAPVFGACAALTP